MQKQYVWHKASAQQDSPEVIHQTLAYGTLEDFKHLTQTTGLSQLRHIFISHPRKVYTPSTLNFIKKFALKIDQPLNEQKYLKNSPRVTR